MKEEICENCGHERQFHFEYGCEVNMMYGKQCPCKKFEEKMTDKELYESTLGRPFDKKPQNHSPTEPGTVNGTVNTNTRRNNGNKRNIKSSRRKMEKKKR